MSSAPLGFHTPNIVVGVAGGIAAYKAVLLVRELVSRGANVTVIPTYSALKFVGVPTWEALSRNPVTTDLFEGVAEVRHVALGQKADLIIIAPATAHSLAQLATGTAGDLLGTTVLASKAPLLVAPAMHTEMWDNAAVQANVNTLTARGVHFVGPDTGELTGGDVGAGRMSEPADIADYAWALLGPQKAVGKKILISAGGTREPLDPVRFIGNHSTGHMGIAIARAAQLAGATVTVVGAHLELPVPPGIRLHRVSTSQEMHEALRAEQPEADIVVMAAAVSDWVAASVSAEKVTKRDQGDHWAPDLVKGPDILRDLAQHKPEGQLLVGFAAETSGDPQVREEAAREKLARKGADVIVLNHVGVGLGFGEVETAVTMFFDASPQSLSLDGTKTSVAEHLVEVLLDH
jgi:phosphopantothenoylcysteine decarboxylase/phosphopantothenate--cysteine ligase